MKSCPFCAYATGRVASELLVFEDEDVLVFPSRQQKPGNRGHCLVVTRGHIPNLMALPNRISAPMLRAVSSAARAVETAFTADAVAIRQNNGAASGQDVFHVHFHVIPRFDADGFASARYEVVEEAIRAQQAAALRRVWSEAPSS